jgi:hypothetical protein
MTEQSTRPQGLSRHCERSEAIHSADAEVLDCFVAEPVIGAALCADPLAPRNDVDV